MNIPTPKLGVNFLVDHFGTVFDKNESISVKRFTWRNSNEVQIQLITYGATITSVKCPDKYGCSSDILLGFDELQSYLKNIDCHFGSIICETTSTKSENAKVKKNGAEQNVNEVNRNLNRVVWDDHVIGNKVVLTFSSEKANCTFPVMLIVSVTFELNEYNEFIIQYKSLCTHMSVTNITHTCYFNLGGHYAGYDEIVKHSVKLIGDIGNFFNSGPKCFREPVYLREFIEGPDNCEKLFTVNKESKSNICLLVATIAHESTRRIIEVYSNSNGLKIDVAYNLPKSDRENRLKFKDEVEASSDSESGTLKLISALYQKIKELAHINRGVNCKEISKLIKHIEDSKKFGYEFTNSTKKSGSFSSCSSSNIKIGLSPIQMIYMRAILEVTKNYEDNPEINYLRHKFKWLLNDDHSSSTRTLVDFTEPKPEPKKLYIPGKFGAKYYKYDGVCVKPTRSFELNENVHNLISKCKPRHYYKHTVIYKFVTTTA